MRLNKHRQRVKTETGDPPAAPVAASRKTMKTAEAELAIQTEPVEPLKSAPPVSVWLIEDNENFRVTLSRVVNGMTGAECRHQFSNAEDALDALQAGDVPDIVLLDVGLPGKNGIEAIKEIKAISPTTRIIMLTVFDDHEKVFKAVCAGASGYLLKPSNTAQIVRSIKEAISGGAPMTPQVAKSVLDMLSGRAAPKSAQTLTNREQAVLRLMAQGRGMKGIADELNLSYHTVDSHLRNIYAKLHVHSSTAAVAKAVKEGLL
jgi:DNA-binding NarL/FixJ family response regulator